MAIDEFEVPKSIPTTRLQLAFLAFEDLDTLGRKVVQIDGSGSTAGTGVGSMVVISRL